MASKDTIIGELSALSSHYPTSTRSPGEQARWLYDFADDLARFSDDAVRLACADWRRSDARRFPTPGQLVATCSRFNLPSQTALPSPRAEAWRKPSAEAYADMTIIEKIRAEAAMASDARGRAGPMFAGGKPVGPADLPQRWHDWTAKAKEHEAEAARLRTILTASVSQRRDAA